MQNWPEPVFDYEADSKMFVQKVKTEQKYKSEAKVPVDSTGRFEKTYSVYMNEGKAWDAYMIKVDLKNGLERIVILVITYQIKVMLTTKICSLKQRS